MDGWLYGDNVVSLVNHSANNMRMLLFKGLLTSLIASFLIVIGVSSYWDHVEERDKWKKLEELIVNPNARPDAWTKTMDDKRLIQICVSIRILLDGVVSRDDIDKVLNPLCLSDIQSSNMSYLKNDG